MDIIKTHVKSNGFFSIIAGPYEKGQHPNQQCGLDLYVDALDHSTGNINTVKLYDNKKGLHFKIIFAPNKQPLIPPYFSMACFVYSEQLG